MLDELLTDVIQEMRVLAGEKVHLKLTEIDQVTLTGDRDRLKQVFINLIANAIHYSPIGGDVYIGLSRSQEMARVIIRDMGPGIPAKDLPHIFDRFYRGEIAHALEDERGLGWGFRLPTFWWMRTGDESRSVLAKGAARPSRSICRWQKGNPLGRVRAAPGADAPAGTDCALRRASHSFKRADPAAPRCASA